MLPYTHATWRKLSCEETGNLTFCPKKSNLESLEAAWKKMTNPVWCEIYGALIRCRRNIITVYPEEYVTFPIKGEPDITKSNTGIQQNWSKRVMLYEVLDCNGDLKCFKDLYLVNGPIKMEYAAMKAAIERKVELLKTFCK